MWLAGTNGGHALVFQSVHYKQTIIKCLAPNGFAWELTLHEEPILQTGFSPGKAMSGTAI